MKLKDILLESRKRQAEAAEDFLGQLVKSSPFRKSVYVVGGAVRDQLRGKKPKDLDIVIAQKDGGIRFAEWVTKKLGIYKSGSNPVIYPRFGTAKFQLYGVSHNGIDLSDFEIETVMTRTEKYTTGSRKPDVDYGSIEQDARRRDLTFNAIYKQIDTGRIVDPLKIGLADLEKNVARPTDEPDIIFKDDPLRMLRAIRFAVRDNSKLPLYVVKAIKKNGDWIKSISAERIREELVKILSTSDAHKGLRLMEMTDLLGYIFPNVRPDYNAHQKITTGYVTHLVDLVSGLGEAKAKQLLASLKFTNDEIKQVVDILRTVESFGREIPDSQIRDIRLELGDEVFQKALDLSIARGENRSDVENRWKKIDINVQMPVNGNDIIQTLGVDPRREGKLIGQILSGIRQVWLKNPKLSKERALDIGQQLYDRLKG